MSGPLAPLARARAADIWLRSPDRALALLERGAGDDGPSLSLLAWLRLTRRRDRDGAEAAARAALAQDGDARFAVAALTEVLLARAAYDEALQTVAEGERRSPEVPWYRLTRADALAEAGRIAEAEEVLEEAAASGKPLERHAVKRLSRLALARNDSERALHWFGELIALAPDYLVYASDYVTLGDLQLGAGNTEAARDAWKRGAAIYPRNAPLRERLAEHAGGDPLPPPGRPNIDPVDEAAMGVERIPIRTEMITLRTGLHDVIDDATRAVRRPGDVIAVAESPAASGIGRIVPLELVRPTGLARFLSRFVGAIGPLHSHEGMQGAIMEAGRARVLLAAVAGAAGKLVRQRGWFYRVAGRRTAMIDDVAAALPPNDHHVLFGPGDADGLAAELSDRLGCDVAVVDANHLTGAWVIGATPDVDRRWLTAALNDNPAGNEDEQTPVVIVRRSGAETV